MKKTLNTSLALLLIVLLIPFTSCKKEEPEKDVIASFTFKIDADDYKKVQFTNESTNFSTLSWNFGDGETSTEENPLHIYTDTGEFTVSLTATSEKGGKTDTFTQKVVIDDPNVLLTILAGEDSKTWKLIRDVSTGRYPLEVGPENYSEIWWAMGYNNDELAIRPCMLNDEWTFYRDGRMVYDTKGDYWAEGGLFSPDNICAPTSQMVGQNGEDLSAWGDGNHSFELTPGDTPKLKAIGKGAFVGFFKLGNGTEVSTPQDYVEYNVVQLYDGSTDTLVVEGIYRWDPAESGGYWRFTLVHYDNPADEPPIPGNMPTASFDYAIDGLTVHFNNTSTFSDSFLWDFGDGSTSSETSPSHTYAEDGFYDVSLTASNDLGDRTTIKSVLVSGTVLTDELLQGDPWRIRVSENSVYVGPGMNNNEWWVLPKAFLDGSSSGGDDWSCMADDEFTFSEGGIFSYNTLGSARNDGYFGSPNGCWSDEEIAASGNGAAFGSALGDNAHSYEFIPASGDSRPIIILTNGIERAAFLGFYKGYYGGENADGNNPPNGGSETNRYEVMGYAKGTTNEYLIVSVDISAEHSGSVSWTMVLER